MEREKNMEKEENKKTNKFKYTIIIIIMFVVGIVIGIIFSNLSNDKKSSTPNEKEQGNIISEERAKEIALEDAKKDFTKEAKLDTDLYVKREKEDGIEIYEVDFILEGMDYEYKIKVSDGTIVDKDREIITNNNVISSNSNSNNDMDTLTLENAKLIALKDSNLKENEVNLLKTKKEMDDGISIYEIEFSDIDKIYDYEISTITGEIISKEIELKNKNLSGSSNLTEEQAKEIALTHSGLKASNVTMKKIELERETNYTAYEVEFYQGNKEYEYEIHSTSGTILKYSWKVR